jgi:hypothetical protein
MEKLAPDSFDRCPICVSSCYLQNPARAGIIRPRTVLTTNLMRTLSSSDILATISATDRVIPGILFNVRGSKLPSFLSLKNQVSRSATNVCCILAFSVDSLSRFIINTATLIVWGINLAPWGSHDANECFYRDGTAQGGGCVSWVQYRSRQYISSLDCLVK